MMSDEQRQKISSAEDWLKGLRNVAGNRSGGAPSVVHAIEARLETERDQAVRRQLSIELASEYRQLEKYDDSERLYLKLCDQSPDEPMPLILLAGQKLYDEHDPVSAMTVIDRALVSAFRSGNFRRLALGLKARIALADERFGIIEDVIRQLLQLRNDPRGVDIGIERDFFDRMPPGSIDKALAFEFVQYAESKSEL